MTDAKRLTQEQRSAITSRKLRKATIELISEIGLANTTTVNIAKRAGVTRGALMHHYRDKTDLVIDATREMWEKSIASTRGICQRFVDGEVDLEGFVDALWERSFSENYVSVTMDMIIAARAEERILLHVDASVKKLFESYDEAAEILFAAGNLSKEKRALAMNMLTSLLRGLRIQNMMSHDPQVAVALRQMVTLILKGALDLEGVLDRVVAEDGTKTSENNA